MMKVTALLAAVVLLTVAPTGEAKAEGASRKRAPIAPSDILYGTTELLYDIYAAAYEAADGMAAKYGVHAAVKEHSSKILPADPVEVACSKLGCKKKEVMDKVKVAQDAVLQVKGTVYEHGMKAHEFVNGHAHTIGTHLEKQFPGYAGHMPKTAVDLLFVSLYVLFVMYIVFKIASFFICLCLSIFCCVCCCCCRRKGKGGKNSGKNGKKDNAAADKGKAAMKSQPKAKAGKK
jgi:hypothetical protein